MVEEYKVYGELSGDQNEIAFASAVEQGFHSGGWKAALSNGIQARQATRKTAYFSAFEIDTLYASLGDKDAAFEWLNVAYRERDVGMERLKVGNFVASRFRGMSIMLESPSAPNRSARDGAGYVRLPCRIRPSEFGRLFHCE
jgi:hypothetical protein